MDSHYVSAYVWPTLCPLHPSLQQDICYVEVGVQLNGKQLFSSVTYSKLIELGEECVIYLLIFLTDIFTNYRRNIHEKKFSTHEKKLRAHEAPMRKNFAPTKHPREKTLSPRNTHEKKFWNHSKTWEKISDPRNNHKKLFRINEGTMTWDLWDPKWYEIHGI